MDFTLKTYRQLLESLQNAGFSFITFVEYLESEELKQLKPFNHFKGHDLYRI